MVSMELYVCESVNPKMCTHTEPYTRDTHTATFLLLPPIPITLYIT